jgi:hypothetical protein
VHEPIAEDVQRSTTVTGTAHAHAFTDEEMRKGISRVHIVIYEQNAVKDLLRAG